MEFAEIPTTDRGDQQAARRSASGRPRARASCCSEGQRGVEPLPWCCSARELLPADPRPAAVLLDVRRAGRRRAPALLRGCRRLRAGLGVVRRASCCSAGPGFGGPTAVLLNARAVAIRTLGGAWSRSVVRPVRGGWSAGIFARRSTRPAGKPGNGPEDHRTGTQRACAGLRTAVSGLQRARHAHTRDSPK